MESLMSDPSMKNMFVVNDDSTDELKTEFFETMQEVKTKLSLREIERNRAINREKLKNCVKNYCNMLLPVLQN